jgi:hypothetical protein
MTLLSGSTAADVDADLGRCWGVVEDVVRWPDWQQGLESVAVVENDERGRPAVCDIVADAKITKIQAHVRVVYEAPNTLTFTLIQSDHVDKLDGSWELRDAGDGRTHAVYTLAVDPGPVGFMARALEKALRPIVVGRRAEELGREVAARGQ